MWMQGELIAFDLETTGVDPFVDVPVSYALLRIADGQVLERSVCIVDPGRPIPPQAMAVHGISDEMAAQGVELRTAIETISSALLDASERGVPTVGFKLDFDLTMIDVQTREYLGTGLMESGYRGPVLDPLVIDRHFVQRRRGKRRLVDLCQIYGVVNVEAHEAASDARAAFDLLTRQCEQIELLAAMEVRALYDAQVTWHAEWAREFRAWLAFKDIATRPVSEEGWPIARRDNASTP